jgi:hypothetical protein
MADQGLFESVRARLPDDFSLGLFDGELAMLTQDQNPARRTGAQAPSGNLLRTSWRLSRS